MSKSDITKTINLWSELSNPLRYLTKSQIQQMLDMAKHGNDSRLQVAFYEMERTMPIYGVVLQKRLAGIQNKSWSISPINESDEAKDQADEVKDVFTRCDLKNTDGLSEAIRHLSLASFRGRSAVKPFIEMDEDGTISLLLKKINNWNLLEWNNHLFWCPSNETMFLPGHELQKLPDGVYEVSQEEVACLIEERPIDIPGIEIYLRQIVGEDTWSRATERYGVAQVIITPPEGTPDSALPQWSERAMRIFNGGSGVLPPGSDVKVMTEARGQDPFSEYVKHQTEQIVLLACGSTLGTLAGPTGLGSGLAETQETSFNSLVNYDAKRISNVLNDVVVKKVCKALGYNKPLCKFEFVKSNTTKPEEYLAMAKSLKDLDIAIDVAELKNLTGLSFIDLETVQDNQSNQVNQEEWSPQDK